MTPMEPFETASNFNEDVGLFEAATHSAVVNIPVPAVQTIALALDGTDRDATTRGIAETLVARTGARLETLDAPSGATAILQALQARSMDLLVLPVPFGPGYAELGADSLGSVADRVLLKAPCPVLCVRSVQQPAEVQATLHDVLVPIAVADELVPRALGWAFRVTPAGGRIDLVAVGDCDVLAEASHLLKTSGESTEQGTEQLSRALVRDIGGLVSAAQKLGSTEDRTVHVEVRVGEFVPLVLKELYGRPHLIIWGIDRSRSSPAFHRAVDLLLSSTGAVLMV